MKINYEEFEKVDFHSGTVVKVEAFPKRKSIIFFHVPEKRLKIQRGLLKLFLFV